jgi:hypothetical protein
LCLFIYFSGYQCLSGFNCFCWYQCLCLFIYFSGYLCLSGFNCFCWYQCLWIDRKYYVH